MKIVSFNPAHLRPGHEDTILAQGVFTGADIGAPFSCAFGVVKSGKAQKPERSPVSKIYYVRFGEGVMLIDDEEEIIREGDVVYIPSGAWHTVRNDCEQDLGTFAIWWTPS